MNYDKASDAPNGTDSVLVRKLPYAIAKAARARVQANGDAAAVKVLAKGAAVAVAVQPFLLVDLSQNANDAAIDAVVEASWATIAAVGGAL